MSARLVVGITGASGAVYGRRCVEVLVREGQPVSLVMTEAARTVCKLELGLEVPPAPGSAEWLTSTFGRGAETLIEYLDERDLAAAPSSGSYPTRGMVILPCSMSTLASVAMGVSGNLLERAADVHLKERRRLVLVPREAPYHEIHLENMLKLRRMGADILPASPGFYHQPTEIGHLVDFVVQRALGLVGVDVSLYQRWEGPPAEAAWGGQRGRWTERS